MSRSFILVLLGDGNGCARCARQRRRDDYRSAKGQLCYPAMAVTASAVITAPTAMIASFATGEARAAVRPGPAAPVAAVFPGLENVLAAPHLAFHLPGADHGKPSPFHR